MTRSLACVALVLNLAACTGAEPSPAERQCSAYRDALTRYAQCEPVALPATADPATITCVPDHERLTPDAGDLWGADDVIPLDDCTRLLRQNTDPCVTLLWQRESDATTVQRDEQEDLRADLRQCAFAPVDAWSRASADDCTLWKRAANAYRSCDPGVVPSFEDDAACVDDTALGEGRSVRACAQELEERAYPLCHVPLGEARERCVTDVLAR